MSQCKIVFLHELESETDHYLKHVFRIAAGMNSSEIPRPPSLVDIQNIWLSGSGCGLEIVVLLGGSALKLACVTSLTRIEP